MEKEWIVLIATLSGAMVAAGSAYFLKRLEVNNQAKREDRKVVLEKLELIHEMLYTIPNKTNSHTVNVRILRLKTKDIASQPELVENIETRRNHDLDFSLYIWRTSALISVYASEFSSDAQKMMQCSNNIFKSLPDYHNEGIDKQLLFDALSELSTIAVDLQFKIAKKIKTEFFDLKD